MASLVQITKLSMLTSIISILIIESWHLIEWCQHLDHWVKDKKSFQYDARLPTICASSSLSSNMSKGGGWGVSCGVARVRGCPCTEVSPLPCTVRSKLNKIEHVQGGPCLVRSNASWVMATCPPPPPTSWLVLAMNTNIDYVQNCHCLAFLMITL